MRELTGTGLLDAEATDEAQMTTVFPQVTELLSVGPDSAPSQHLLRRIITFLGQSEFPQELHHATLQGVFKCLQSWSRTLFFNKVLESGIVRVLTKTYDDLLLRDYSRIEVLNSVLELLYAIEDFSEVAAGKEEFGKHFVPRLLALAPAKSGSVKLQRAAMDTLCALITKCSPNQQAFLRCSADCHKLFRVVLPRCGDYSTQATISEILLRLLRKGPHLLDLIEDEVPRAAMSQMLRLKIPKLSAEIRHFVCAMNQSLGSLRRVYSFLAHKITVNGNDFSSAEDRWVDFGDDHLSFYALTMSSQKDADNSAQLIDIQYRQIIKIHRTSETHLEIVVASKINNLGLQQGQGCPESSLIIFDLSAEDILTVSASLIPLMTQQTRRLQQEAHPSQLPEPASGSSQAGRKASYGIVIPLPKRVAVEEFVEPRPLKSRSVGSRILSVLLASRSHGTTSAREVHAEHSRASKYPCPSTPERVSGQLGLRTVASDVGGGKNAGVQLSKTSMQLCAARKAGNKGGLLQDKRPEVCGRKASAVRNLEPPCPAASADVERIEGLGPSEPARMQESKAQSPDHSPEPVETGDQIAGWSKPISSSPELEPANAAAGISSSSSPAAPETSEIPRCGAKVPSKAKKTQANDEDSEYAPTPKKSLRQPRVGGEPPGRKKTKADATRVRKKPGLIRTDKKFVRTRKGKLKQPAEASSDDAGRMGSHVSGKRRRNAVQNFGVESIRFTGISRSHVGVGQVCPTEQAEVLANLSATTPTAQDVTAEVAACKKQKVSGTEEGGNKAAAFLQREPEDPCMGTSAFTTKADEAAPARNFRRQRRRAAGPSKLNYAPNNGTCLTALEGGLLYDTFLQDDTVSSKPNSHNGPAIEDCKESEGPESSPLEYCPADCQEPNLACSLEHGQAPDLAADCIRIFPRIRRRWSTKAREQERPTPLLGKRDKSKEHTSVEVEYQSDVEVDPSSGEIGIVANMLHRLKKRSSLLTQQKIAQILCQVSTKAHLHIQSLASAFEKDNEELKKESKRRFGQLEDQLRDGNQKMIAAFQQYRNELSAHLQLCEHIFGELETTKAEVLLCADKQRAAHQKLVSQAQEAGSVCILEAEVRLKAVSQAAGRMEKVVQLLKQAVVEL